MPGAVINLTFDNVIVLFTAGDCVLVLLIDKKSISSLLL